LYINQDSGKYRGILIWALIFITLKLIV